MKEADTSFSLAIARAPAAVLAVCTVRGWVPVMDPRLIVAIPLAATLIGTTPALRASRPKPSRYAGMNGQRSARLLPNLCASATMDIGDAAYFC